MTKAHRTVFASMRTDLAQFVLGEMQLIAYRACMYTKPWKGGNSKTIVRIMIEALRHLMMDITTDFQEDNDS